MKRTVLICVSLVLLISENSQAAEKMLQTGGAPFQPTHDCAECPDMVMIPAGSFNMGSDNGDDEGPVHRVTIGKPFMMGRTEITQGQWRLVMGNNPSRYDNCGDNCPVENVSWGEAREFIQKLNAKTGKQYRLPSEAEWEYACRAGVQNDYCGGDDVNVVAWYFANSDNGTHPVATKRANAWGLYDMSGNVWEWVEDSYHPNYNGAPTDGSAWQGGAKRVLRGGSWFLYAYGVRPTYRNYDLPVFRFYDIGFRVAATLP